MAKGIDVWPAGERHHLRTAQQNMWLTFFPGRPAAQTPQGFGPLAALNEGRVAPEGMMLPYSRSGYEVITYVLKGTLTIADRKGRHPHVLDAGDFQRTTVDHDNPLSYSNAARTEAHVVQFSLLRSNSDHRARPAEWRVFRGAARSGELCLVASADGENHSLPLAQDARVYSCVLAPGCERTFQLLPGRMAWLQVLRGHLELDGVALADGDGASCHSSDGSAAQRNIIARTTTEILLLDLPASSVDTGTRSSASRADSKKPPVLDVAHG